MNRHVKTGIGILSVIIFIAIFAPVLSTHDPYELGIPYLPPSTEHFLGTNDVGQDIFSELLYGSRISLLIGIVSAFVVTVIGTFLGTVAGYCGGMTDKIIVQISNVAMSIPSLALTIVLVAFMETNLKNLIIAICVTAWTSTMRIVRSRVQQIKEQPFVKLEKTMGASSFYIMFRHILPNLGEIVFVRGVMGVTNAMLTEASLSFFGLGVLGQKSWGSILHYAFYRKGIINGYYWWYLPPIICISLSVLGFMLLGYYGKNNGKSKSRRKIVNA